MTKKIPRPLFFLGTVLTFFLALFLLSIPKTTSAACTGKIKCEFKNPETNKCDGSAGYATTGCKVQFGVCGGNGCCGVPNSGCGCEIGDSCKVTGCTPQCSGKECGPDGCGGSCGSCGGGETCDSSGQCVGSPPPVCDTTAPSSLVVTRLSPTQGRIDWTPGANGTKQLLRVGANLTEVNSGCPGTGSPPCVVKEDNLPTTQTSYTTGNVLTAGTVYYWRVVNYKDAACYSDSAVVRNVSSCEISPSSLSLQAGSTGNLTSSVNSSSEISSVNYVSADTGIATVNPASDTTYVYQTTVSGVSPGPTTVRNDVIIGGSVNCTANSSVTVTNPGPWWQVRDADIVSYGDIISPIPSTCTLPVCNPVFNLQGTGGFPGVTVYGGTVADFQAGSGTGTVAEAPYSWLANTGYSSSRVYDYSYFERQIPNDVTFTEISSPTYNGGDFNSGGAPSRGYVWYHFDGATLGDMTISGNVNLTGSRKVVLLVEGADLYITGRINVQSPGNGYFMAVVGKDSNGLKGNIIVDPSVSHPTNPAIEGVYLAEGEFRTGAGTNRLYLRGAVASYGGVVLERDLGSSNDDTPSEYFEYAPDIIATFPQVFTSRRLRWKEVAP